MNKKKIFFSICFLIVAVVLYSLIRSWVEGDKGKIKRLIFSAARAIEKEDLLRLNNYISFDYYDKYGNNRRSLIFLSQRIFYEYEDITVQIKELEIEVEVDNLDAQAQIEAMGKARIATKTQEKNPLEYDIIKFKVYFKKQEDNKWKVIELEYLEPGEIRFFPVA